MAQNPTISKMETTAVEWLKDMLESNYGDPQMLEISWKNLDDLIQRAKQMEKEQRIKDYNAGYTDAQCNHINDAENYANEQDYLNG